MARRSHNSFACFFRVSTLNDTPLCLKTSISHIYIKLASSDLHQKNKTMTLSNPIQLFFSFTLLFQYYLNYFQTTKSTLYSCATGKIDITCNAGNPCIDDLFICAKDMDGSDIQIECSVNDACKHLTIYSAKDVNLNCNAPGSCDS